MVEIYSVKNHLIIYSLENYKIFTILIIKYNVKIFTIIFNKVNYIKKIAIFIYILTSFKLIAEYSHDINFLGAGYDIREEEKDKIKKLVYDRDLSSFIIYNGRLRESNSYISKINMDLDFNLIKNTKNNENVKIYLGDNFNLKSDFSKFSIIFGRKSFPSMYRSDSSWKDGMEGIGLSTSFKNGSILNLYFFDIYRGYPLLKNDFYIPKKIEYGDRLRYGFDYNFENNFFYINYSFSLTQFWNWGKFSVDRQDSKLGDGDFLYHNSLTLGYRVKNLNSFFSFLSSRGVDKTNYDPYRKSSSLIFSGEGLQLGFSFDFQRFKLLASFFLPDANRRNQQGEVLEIGYVGMGAYYSEGFLISQVLNFLPANWVTGNGLEISDSILNGTRNSYFQKLNFVYKLDKYKLQLISEIYIPYKDNISINSNIYYNKKYFSESHLHELTGNIESNFHQNLILKLQISYLFPSLLQPYNGSSVFFSCSINI